MSGKWEGFNTLMIKRLKVPIISRVSRITESNTFRFTGITSLCIVLDCQTVRLTIRHATHRGGEESIYAICYRASRDGINQ